MSSSRDLPQRFSGARMTSRGACAHAGCAWVAAIHSTTASAACGGGQDDVAGEGAAQPGPAARRRPRRRRRRSRRCGGSCGAPSAEPAEGGSGGSRGGQCRGRVAPARKPDAMVGGPGARCRRRRRCARPRRRAAARGLVLVQRAAGDELAERDGGEVERLVAVALAGVAIQCRVGGRSRPATYGCSSSEALCGPWAARRGRGGCRA